MSKFTDPVGTTTPHFANCRSRYALYVESCISDTGSRACGDAHFCTRWHGCVRVRGLVACRCDVH